MADKKQSGQLVQFRWFVPRAGYRWIRGSEDQRRWLVTNEPAPAPSGAPHSAVTEPLRETPGLFLTFAELDASEEAICDFADRHGWLGLEVDPRLRAALPVIGGRRAPGGELRKDWARAIAQMRLACHLLRAIERNDREAFRRLITEKSWTGREAFRRWIADKSKSWDKHDPETLRRLAADNRKEPLLFSDHSAACEIDGAGVQVTPRDPHAALLKRGDLRRAARVLLQHLANEQLDLHTSARVLMVDEKTGRQGLYVNPTNLLGAMWVQLADSIDAGRSSRRCSQCREWMVLAPGTNRADRTLCSDRCKVAAYRERKKTAALLHRRGHPPSAIAKKLGSDVEKVRGWLGLGKETHR